MADWWDSAPVVSPQAAVAQPAATAAAPSSDAWWNAAPVIEAAPTTRTRTIGGRGGVTPVTVTEPIVQHPDSGLARIGQGADDLMRAVANGATLGAADKAAAYMGSDGTDYTQQLAKQRALTEQSTDRDPGQALVGGLAGNALGVAATAGAGLTTAPLMAGAPLAGRIGLGAIEGGGYGAANALGHNDGEMGWQKVWAALHGAGAGSAFGAALPAAGSVAGKAYEMAAPFFSSTEGLSPRASGILTNAANADSRGMQNLSQIGPQAMPVDAGPSMAGLGQGAALAPGDARSTIIDALTQRNLGRNARLGDDLTQNFGPYQDPVLATQSVKDARKALTGPMYTKAFADAGPVDASPVTDLISNRLQTAEGAEKAALQKIQGMLVEAPAAAAVAPQRVASTTPAGGTIYHMGGGSPAQPQQIESMAERLHNIKGEVDSLINYGDPTLGIQPGSLSREQGALVQVRKALNGSLENQVPGYAAANARSSEYARMGDSIETGFNALKKGDQAVSPALWQHQAEAATPAELGGIQIGVRGRLENAVGTQANDLAALRGQVGEPQDWNSQKLAQIYSPEQAEGFSSGITREQTFAKTYNDVANGSQTGPRLAAQKQLADRGEIHIPPIMEWPTAAASAGARTVLKAMLNRSSEGVRNEIAAALTSTGDARDQIVRALLSASQAQGQVGANIRNVIGNPALIRALALSHSSAGQ